MKEGNAVDSWNDLEHPELSSRLEYREILAGPQGNFRLHDDLFFRDPSTGVAELIHPDVDHTDITRICFTLGDNEGNGYIQVYLKGFGMIVKRLKYEDLCRLFLTEQQQHEEKKKEKFNSEEFRAAVDRDLRALALPQEGTDLVTAMNAVPGLVTTINNAFWIESNTDAVREQIAWSVMGIAYRYEIICGEAETEKGREKYSVNYREYLESVWPERLLDSVKRLFLARLPIEKQTWVRAVWARGQEAN